MPATRKTAPASRVADLSSVQMTPVMTQMHEVSDTLRDLAAAAAGLDTINMDLTEAAWVERHRAGDILTAQGRPYSGRGHLYKRLKERDIDATGGWNTSRLRPEIDEQPLPDYIDEDEIKAIREQADALLARITRIQNNRDQQYPADHENRLSAIETWHVTQAS
ncbi:hypothetical protein [Streptomyces sp. A0642]|uniref:hypothetical protein n=1 Tax=Streptomyces sp. A0642 TaxID=2563100 RepID=UPI0014473660|nr:hypothetical protein [Streptomyces sp. A0642]